MMTGYHNRLVDSELRDRLQRAGAVVIEGPKACGKTMTARRVCQSEIRLDVDPTAALLLNTAPDVVLEGATPRLLDEWQVVPNVWNHVRRAVDDRQQHGQFVLTGSAMPADDATRHSGAGRFSRLRMRPMSSVEIGLSSGEVSIGDILKGITQPQTASTKTFYDVIDAVCSGGWPRNLYASRDAAMQNVREYLEESTRVDIATYDIGQKPRDPRRISAVLQSISRGLGSAISVTTIMQDVRGEDLSISESTVYQYLDAITSVMLLEHLPAWRTHLRSRATLRTRPKYYLTDPSLAIASLRARPETLIRDLELLGQVFENLVIRDLLVYSQHINASVSYYRDSNGLEVDAIIEHYDGRWCALEIKLGIDSAELAAQNLLAFSSVIDTSRKGAPTALVVITSTGPAYRRPDGVYVVPISHLGP